jgi:hypothetical protein
MLALTYIFFFIIFSKDEGLNGNLLISLVIFWSNKPMKRLHRKTNLSGIFKIGNFQLQKITLNMVPGKLEPHL